MAKTPRSEFVRGTLELMVLSVLVDQPKYGYLIQQRVRQASGGQVKLPAGTLYPLLHRLEADGVITSRMDTSTGRQRKWYRLTALGKRQLKSQAQQWQDHVKCLRGLLTPVLDAK